MIYPKLSDGSALVSSYEYDKINRLTKIINKKGTTILSEYNYTYDNNGNIESVTDGQGTASYIYDKLNRLVEIHRADGNTVIYTYDLKRNRKTLEDNNPVIDFDSVSYEYSARDQLTGVTKGMATTTIKYLPDGLRYMKSSSGKTVQYHYNMDGKVIAESDGTGSITANYVWGPDKVLAKKDTASGKNYYYLYNGHGDVVQIIDSNGQVVNNYIYDEWGNILSQTENIENPFKYAGEIFDKETGLYYLRARYYDPTLGRFISEDTYEGEVTNPLSLNWYTYVQGNPLKYVDTYGHNIVQALAYFIGAYNNYKETGSFKEASLAGSDTVITVSMIALSFYDVAAAVISFFDSAKLYSEMSKGGVNTTKPMTWNEFQSANKGLYDKQGMSKAWVQYKEVNNIVTGTTRNQAAKSTFLKELADSGKAPKWMNQWLKNGKVPPGFQVDHIVPLSIRGEDIPSNMRLLDEAFHKLHHSKGFFRPWE